MIELALLSGFIIGAILTIFAYVCRQFEDERTKWFEERQILLNRIQDPKYKPPLLPSEKRADMEQTRKLREEFEQFGLVGKIVE